MVYICDCCIENVCKCKDGYKCPDCSSVFDHRNMLEMHLKTHLPKVVKCPHCPREFGSSANVLQHLESGSCVYGKYEAREMIYEFAEEYCLQYTNGYERPITNYPYKCPDCNAMFAEGSQSLQHQEDKHGLNPHCLSSCI